MTAPRLYYTLFPSPLQHRRTDFFGPFLQRRSAVGVRGGCLCDALFMAVLGFELGTAFMFPAWRPRGPFHPPRTDVPGD